MPYKEFEVNGIGKVTIYKRRGNRSLRLTVAPDGAIRVSIPLWAPYKSGLAFTLSRKAWIDAQVKNTDAPLTSGLAIGKTRHLLFMTDTSVSTVRTSVRSDRVVVTRNPAYSHTDPIIQKAAETACWRALKQESVALLTPRLNQLATTYGFHYRSLNVKRMKTRWGSCDQAHNIVLNLFLVQLPWECIDYVILHELTHTRALHHGPEFWRQFELVLPNAKLLRRRMRAFRPVLQTGRTNL